MSENRPRESLPDPATPVTAVIEPGRGPDTADDIVDEWGMQSFPASDPPATWRRRPTRRR